MAGDDDWRRVRGGRGGSARKAIRHDGMRKRQRGHGHALEAADGRTERYT